MSKGVAEGKSPLSTNCGHLTNLIKTIHLL